MKIEKLATNKIRVTVTPLELNDLDIDPKELSPDLPQLRNFIASLIEQACDYADEQLIHSNILVEARPQGEDFVFVITRLRADDESAQKESAKLSKKQKLANGSYKAKIAPENKCSYFAFNSLTCFCEMLRNTGCESFCGTKLFKSQNEFYLRIDRSHIDFKRLCMIASEYARPLQNSDAADEYINEHAIHFADSKDFFNISRCY